MASPSVRNKGKDKIVRGRLSEYHHEITMLLMSLHNSGEVTIPRCIEVADKIVATIDNHSDTIASIEINQ